MKLYFNKDYKDTIQALRKFNDEFPRSTHRFKALYWLAQAYTQEQDRDDAKKIYETLLDETPLSYYGLLASIAIGKDLEGYVAGTLPEAMATDPFLTPDEVLKLQRAERFLAEGAAELAAQNLKEIKIKDSLSSQFLLYLATLNHDSGNHLGAFNILGEISQRGHASFQTSYSMRLIFPVAYYALIQKHATQLKLDPLLVLSLVKQESAFESVIASHAGAMGLMQLMPATAVDTESTIKIAELAEPDHNVRVGTKYLKKMLDRFNGNIALALAAYNAGPNAVARWVREGKAKGSMVEFIESIPYKETQSYVAGIFRNYYWYSRRLNGELPQSLVGYFWNQYGPPELSAPVPASDTPGGEGSGGRGGILQETKNILKPSKKLRSAKRSAS